jgi:glycosyltransferase involved in cell wall biosynthesis
MRVAIDTRSLRSPLTGIGHYVHRLTGAVLPLLSPEEELLAFNGWGLAPLDHNFLAAVEASNSGLTPAASGLTVRKAGSAAYVILRRLDPVRKAVRALQAIFFHKAEKSFDLFHAANYVPPGTFHKPVLPVIYDLSYVRIPQAHPKERVEWLENQLKLIVDVPYIQTISEFSKSEIVAVLGIPPSRIYVAYPAPSPQFQPEPDADETSLARHEVESGKYLLVVATREPRKNFTTVAEAYTALPTALRAQFPLLWVGPSGWGELSLSSAVERSKEAGQIRILGYIPNRDLAALYRNTSLFVMPSIYEGFGMPVVEALACGARVALSRIPVFEEIAGTYARYVDPMDVAGWQLAMKAAIEEGHQAPHCSGAMPDLSRFSWRASAAMTLDLYRRLARNK